MFKLYSKLNICHVFDNFSFGHKASRRDLANAIVSNECQLWIVDYIELQSLQMVFYPYLTCVSRNVIKIDILTLYGLGRLRIKATSKSNCFAN